jgi:cell wall-associated protease
MKKIIILTVSCLLVSFLIEKSFAQSGAEHPSKRPHDWWQADWKKDSIPGISLDEAYNYLKGRKSKPVIVAIIDNCVDTAHEELKDFIWNNTKEIPNNGIDDDSNGYVDDVHGWCFIANKNNVAQTKQSALETLVYMTWKNKFQNIDTMKLDKETRPQYDIYQTAKEMVFERYRFFPLISLVQADSIKFAQYFDNLSPNYRNIQLKDIRFSSLHYSNAYDSIANLFFAYFIKFVPTTSTVSIFKKRLETIPGFFSGFINFVNNYIQRDKYDTTINYRAIIGDDPDNFNDTVYGTSSINISDIGGEHATMIAGIIGANRNNTIGIKGIADNVLIMPLITAVPNGGSISKDMVMAIHYAVDNGASIINMSLGTTPWIDEHENELRQAFDYAYTHNVLIVNAAGNDGFNLDHEKYLLGQGSDGKEHDNYIRVGATTTLMNDNLVAYFSNFGGNTIDIFAPGSAIYSTTPGNNYDSEYGTSFACPIVTGVATLLKSYFPKLTAKQIKEILVQSVYKPYIMVIPPSHVGFTNKIPFGKMSKSGGIVNAYNAVKLADEMMKKK